MTHKTSLKVLLVVSALLAAAFGITRSFHQPSSASAQEFQTTGQTRSPLLQKSLEAFAAAGADKSLLSLLNQIGAGSAELAAALAAVNPPDMARAYSPVPTRHAGTQSSALVFALDAGNLTALDQMIAAGADPTASDGLLAQVAVRHFTGSLLDRNWDLSVAALALYLGAKGDPTFAAPTENLPLFAIALQNGNLPGAVVLLEGGADIWAPTRRQGQQSGAIAAMNYWPQTIEFMSISAEQGAFEQAPKPALEQLVSFYANGFLNEDRDGPDPSFPHAGTIGMKDAPNKAALVARLFRAIEPLSQDHPDIALVLGFANRERQK